MKMIALSLASGTQAYCEWPAQQAAAPTVVMLHGISSGSGSWQPLVRHLGDHRLLAWDAPGYGISRILAASEPTAADYAERLECWLAAMNIEHCILLGHSLGAMMATAYVARYPQRVQGLILADPAEGYRHAGTEEQVRVYQSRWPELERQGTVAYAEGRAPRLLRAGTEAANLERVRAEMGKLNVEGFRRANWMLAHDALADYLPLPAGLPGVVLCGAEDAITPPAGAQALAARLGLPYRSIEAAGHASYIDNPSGFAAAVRELSGQVARTETMALGG
ncbi:alpha/beta hydrolase [Natronospirillum operosum]|uniref:Alpha/beta hydrolase n=1 Tax=Natronospirillum operosum TaxID=2759953 RepID=A0A4Z0WI02_9GAMM|nr:alpha/beta hydrolase [Natronospirillum operosum]TGG94250.1 alpha/beta hydrolase [Natronospirillum operosum]